MSAETGAIHRESGQLTGGDAAPGLWAAEARWPLLVLAVTLIAYFGTVGFEFVHDDIDQIVKNPHVQSWQFVPRYFTAHIWNHVSPEWGGLHYRPLFLMWLRINHSLFGLNPIGWHLTTVGAHLAATLMVYLLARRLLRESASAALAAAVFGLHPVHIEAVAWVSGVNEPLLAILTIASFLCYLNKRESPVKPRAMRWFAASLSLYAMALLTKETAIVFPAIVFSYEWLSSPGVSTRGRRLRSSLSAAAPFVLIAFVYLSVRTLALRGLGARLIPLPFSTTLLTAPSLLWFYIKLLVWPIGLSAFYDVPYVTSISVSHFVLPAIGVLAVAVALWVWSRGSRVVAFASVLMFLPILPVLNLSGLVRDEIAHDRYLYLPSVGFSILVAVALTRLRFGAKLFTRPASQVAAALSVMALLGIATAMQHSYWANEFVLFRRGVDVAPNNLVATTNLGNVMLENGFAKDAAALFRVSYDRDPSSRVANWNLGLAYYQLREFDQALPLLTRAVELDPTGAVKRVYLGLTEIELGRIDEGRATLRQAEDINASTAGVHYGLGMAYKKQGDLQAALHEFQTEASSYPADLFTRSQIREIESSINSAQPARPAQENAK